MFVALLWLFSPTWYAVKLTLEVGPFCPYLVIDPINFPSTQCESLHCKYLDRQS